MNEFYQSKIMNNKEQAIADIIYNNLDYMYCDNCRFGLEIDGQGACDDCHRRYNGWGISKYTAKYLAKEILEILNA